MLYLISFGFLNCVMYKLLQEFKVIWMRNFPWYVYGDIWYTGGSLPKEGSREDI